jgi:hypothetical protein
MSDDGERLSNEELAYSYAEHIRPDFDAEEIEGVVPQGPKLARRGQPMTFER